MHLPETGILFSMKKSWFGRGEFEDPVLRQEIELVGDVIAAADHFQGQLSSTEVDLALGLDSAEAQPDRDRADRVVAAVNAQCRLAPAAREAMKLLPHPGPLYRMLAAISAGPASAALRTG